MSYTPLFNEPCEKRCNECQLAYICKESTVEKPTFFFGEKPIDMPEITELNDSMQEESKDEVPMETEISFDCKVPKETMEWINKQAVEMKKKENIILARYSTIARWNAEYYLPILQQLASEDAKLELLEDIIVKAICKGWNDCFGVNVKPNI